MTKEDAAGRRVSTTDERHLTAASESGALRVTVVVPVRDETSSVPALVRSLREQTYSPAEVIIVDGGSTDDTVALARELTKDDDRFRVIEAGEATPGRGRNVGIAAARNDWIALIDAGIRAEPTWLERLVEVAMSNSEIELVYGNVEAVTETRFERYAALTYPAPKEFRGGGWMRGRCTPCSLMRREIWERAGGFPDLRVSEDLFFMERVERLGVKTGWSPRATVWWQLQPTLARTWRKFVLYSRHNVWAGRAYDWQYGVGRQYAVALVLVLLAVFHSVWWLVLLVLGFAARVAKSIYRHREGRGLRWALDPVQFAAVAVITLTVDFATLVGWAQALSQPPPESIRRAALLARGKHADELRGMATESKGL